MNKIGENRKLLEEIAKDVLELEINEEIEEFVKTMVCVFLHE